MRRDRRARRSLGRGREAALDDELLHSKEPILVDFWAPWCSPCRAMAPAVEAAAEKLAGDAKVYKVNVDENPGLAARYGIRSIPTIVFFKEGAVVDRVVGAAPKAVLRDIVNARA